MRNTISSLSLCVIFCYFSAHAAAETKSNGGAKPIVTTAVLFEFKNKTEKPDFTFEKKDSKNADGTSTQESIFRYPDGRTAFTETLAFSKEGRITSYFYDQKQVSQRIWLTIDGNIMKMKKEWYQGDKVTKTAEEIDEYKPNMHVAPELQDITLKKWSSLTSGESYKFKLIVMEHIDTFSFELEYDGLKDLGGKKLHQFSLYPRSFFIKLLVSPIKFFFENTPERRLLEVRGTLPVKPWNGKEWDGIFEGIMRPNY